MPSNSKTFFEQELERLAKKNSLKEYHYIQVRHSRQFMEKYYSEKIELVKIAEKAFMSHFHYVRIFQKIYGMTPRQYLRDLRISKAKKLLKKGLSVTTVCYEVGYESIQTFSIVFKRGTGYSPKEYQKINKSNLE